MLNWTIASEFPLLPGGSWMYSQSKMDPTWRPTVFKIMSSMLFLPLHCTNVIKEHVKYPADQYTVVKHQLFQHCGPCSKTRSWSFTNPSSNPWKTRSRKMEFPWHKVACLCAGIRSILLIDQSSMVLKASDANQITIIETMRWARQKKIIWVVEILCLNSLHTFYCIERSYAL